MSIRNSGEITEHALYLANGITGLKLLKEHQIRSAELEQFEAYVRRIASYNISLPPSPHTSRVVNRVMNELLEKIKTKVEKGVLGGEDIPVVEEMYGLVDLMGKAYH